MVNSSIFFLFRFLWIFIQLIYKLSPLETDLSCEDLTLGLKVMSKEDEKSLVLPPEANARVRSNGNNW